jgi:hypothetical protein
MRRRLSNSLLGVSVAVTLQTLTLSSLVRSQYPLPNNRAFDSDSKRCYNSVLGDKDEAQDNRQAT